MLNDWMVSCRCAQIPLTLDCRPSILTLQKASSYQTHSKGKFFSDPEEILWIFS
jgi:hypothetical protein